MKANRLNILPFLALFIMIMLNSLAIWAFSFLSWGELFWVYLVNTIPFFLLWFLMKRQSKRKVNKGGFVFMYFILAKFVYILTFLFIYDKIQGFSNAFLANFLIVYLILLYLSIFIGIRFLSKE